MKKSAAQIQIFAPKIKTVEIVLFTKHLSIMLKAGIPINEALETLRDQTKNSSLQAILKKITTSISNGSDLATALKKHPEVFNQFYISMIEVGEEAGTLEENLVFLANQISKDLTLKKKIQGAMLYPGLVLFATIIMSGFLSFFVLPSLVDFFGNLDVALPLSTRILLGFANIMKSYGVFIMIGLILLGIGVRFLITLPTIKPLWHKFLLKLPLVGNLIAYGQLTRFGRNLGVLLGSGVPISHSLVVTTATLSNLTFQKSLTILSKEIESGKTIGEVLSKKKHDIFPALVSKMISVGEKTGHLDETLLYLADFYEEEIDSLSKSFSTILEPFLLLGIGLMVGFVAVAIISPIYELTGSIR